MPDASESDETDARGEYTFSNHSSVSNMMAAHGLEILAQMLAAGGRAVNASTVAAEAATLKDNILRLMWNGSAFCDGICSEVAGNARLFSQIYALDFGFALAATTSVDTMWNQVASWGMNSMGDYGAFWFQMAIAGGYYSGTPYYSPDDGTAIVTALTKCDYYSWCSGLRDDNLTMTRESWHAGTYSHGWGSSAIVGVSWGVLGVHVTEPGWGAFSVTPKLGPLQRVSGVVPTLRGFINVTASPGAADVTVPCGTRATLCTPRSAADTVRLSTAAWALTLDGEEVQAEERAGHLCTALPVGCGVAGAPRAVRVRAR
jgi:Bacterial alpha-L-rhamnosidase C-terminal domain